MGRRLAEARHAGVLANLAQRLQPVLVHAAPSWPDSATTVARALTVLLGGRDANPKENLSEGLLDAARALIHVAAGDGDTGALEDWILRHLHPAGAQTLPCAKSLWTRAVNLERDRQRRHRIEQGGGVPPRVTLYPRHRQLLGELQGVHPREPVAALAGQAIERHHRVMSSKPKRRLIAQPSLDL